MQNNTPIKRIAVLILWLALLSGCWQYYSDEAHAAFLERTDPVSITVYPVRVVAGPKADNDHNQATELVAYLNSEQLGAAVAGTDETHIPVQWHKNQAKMTQETALAFGKQVAADSISTDYALLVELLCSTDERKIGGIQIYLSDAKGRIATGRLSNSHWEEWKEVQPHDRASGIEVAKQLIAMSWAEGRE